MVSKYALRLGRSVLYCRRLLENLPRLEADLRDYMRQYELEEMRVDGHYLELTDGGLEVRPACGSSAQYLSASHVEMRESMEKREQEYRRLRVRVKALVEDARDWFEWGPASDDIKWYAVRVLKALGDWADHDRKPT